MGARDASTSRAQPSSLMGMVVVVVVQVVEVIVETKMKRLERY